MLYRMPQLYGAGNCYVPVDCRSIDVCKEECSFRGHVCDEDVFDLCSEYVSEHGLCEPQTADDAVDMYIYLRCCMRCDLGMQ